MYVYRHTYPYMNICIYRPQIIIGYSSTEWDLLLQANTRRKDGYSGTWRTYP